MTIEAPPRGRVLRTAVWIAAGLAAVAVVWLALLLIVSGVRGLPIEGPFALLWQGLGIVLIIGWLASLTGAVLARIARRRAPSEREGTRMRLVGRMLLPVATLGTAGAVILVLLVIGLTHPFADNPAADAGHRLSSELRANGGSELCSAGDPGLGPDNVQPWFDFWLAVPTSSTEDRAVRAALQRAGFTPAATSWGTGTLGTATASMTLLGSTDVEIDCSSFTQQWGHHVTAPAGETIVEVQVELPFKQ